MHALTEKRLELGRRAALTRLGANVDRIVTEAALKLGFDADQFVQAHIQERNRRLANLGLKLSEHGIAAEAAGVPTLEAMLGKSIDRWNENAVRAERVGFPLRMERGGAHSVRMTGLDQWVRGTEVLLYLSTLERLHVRSWEERLTPSLDSPEYAQWQIGLGLPAYNSNDRVRLEIAAAQQQAADYEWMLDTLLLWIIPENAIERQASSRDGLWDRKLRKTKAGIAMKRLAFQREAMITTVENQREELIRDWNRRMLYHHRKIERDIRSTPGYRDFTTSRLLPTLVEPPKKPESDDK